MSVDVITRRQRKEFLAQKRLVFDESTGSAFTAEEPPSLPSAKRQASSTSPPDSVRKFRVRVARTAIKYSKAPSGVYGMQELQMALYEASAPWQLPPTLPRLVEFLLPALHVALIYYVS